MPVHRKKDRPSARNAVDINVRSLKIDLVTDPETEERIEDEFELATGKISLWRWFKKLFS
jgi:hypothetical protein